MPSVPQYHQSVVLRSKGRRRPQGESTSSSDSDVIFLRNNITQGVDGRGAERELKKQEVSGVITKLDSIRLVKITSEEQRDEHRGSHRE
jgi:hypothetical protein